MKMNGGTWKTVQERLGYNDEAMKKFRENPRNADVLAKAPALMNKTIVAAVVDSHGCNSGHKVGDKFYFDGSGNLITKLCPKRIFSVLYGRNQERNLTADERIQKLIYLGRAQQRIIFLVLSTHAGLPR